MRIMIKGGVWKNTEDEILKAAVMKYGLNQWARISSLLVHKSAKQCKARWYEWLDPWIKKTEWSSEEDEKLLHLARVMPCQWRTIAPIVGRTSAQCLERYEYLLDQAQKKYRIKSDGSRDEGTDSSAMGVIAGSSDDPRRLRAGEIDPMPESKPARPDPMDMDEDEKEMLSEARARLANTQGKKAKRKAREKQLQTARRLASLQKRREMRAAGLITHLFGRRRGKKARKHIDYSAEVPFQRRTPRGFFDTTDEDESARLQTEHARSHFNPTFVSDIEGERRDAIEDRERKKDLQRQRRQKELNLPEVLRRLNSLSGVSDEQILAHSAKKMSLPSPQVSDSELLQLSRMNVISSSNSNHSSGGFETSESNPATRLLVASVAQRPNGLSSTVATSLPSGLSSVRTVGGLTTPGTGGLFSKPISNQNRGLDQMSVVSGATTMTGIGSLRTPSLKQDRIMLEAKNALLSVSEQTPLLGGENAQMEPLPAKKMVSTPTALSAAKLAMLDSVSSDGRLSKKKSRKRARSQKRAVLEALDRLPSPEHDYGVSLPAMPELPAHLRGKRNPRVMDASDRLKRRQARDKRNEMIDWAKRSSVLMSRHPSKKGQSDCDLPIVESGVFNPERFIAVNPQSDWIIPFHQGDSSHPELSVDEISDALSLIRKEMTVMVTDDIMDELVVSSKNKKDGSQDQSKQQPKKKSLCDDVSLAEMKDANEQIIEEMNLMNLEEETHELCDNGSSIESEFERIMDVALRDHTYVPSLGEYRWLNASQKNSGFIRDKIESKKHEFVMLRNELNELKQSDGTQQRKVDILCKGYKQKSKSLLKEMNGMRRRIADQRAQMECFSEMKDRELLAMQYRMKEMRLLLHQEKDRTDQLRLQYANLCSD